MKSPIHHQLVSARQALAVIFVATAVNFTGISQESGRILPPVNDLKLRQQFEKGLQKLKDDGDTVDTALLHEQLERKHYALKLPDEPAEPLTTPEIYRRAREATLIFGRIYMCGKCDKWHGSGAGAVIIHPSGIAVTNYHVMEKKDEPDSAFGGMDAKGNIYAVSEVLAASEKDDLAIVKLKGEDFPYVPVSLGDAVGTEVRVISHPNGRYFCLSEGIIARYFVDHTDRTPRVQITADYAKGSSGSGVFNPQGELTGIVAATSSIYYTEKKNVQKDLQMVVKSCIPAESVRRLLKPKE